MDKDLTKAIECLYCVMESKRKSHEIHKSIGGLK